MGWENPRPQGRLAEPIAPSTLAQHSQDRQDLHGSQPLTLRCLELLFERAIRSPIKTHECGTKSWSLGSRCYGDERPPYPHPLSQKQGSKCSLDRCKCPGAFSGLGAVELSVLCSSPALGALGCPSRSTLAFSQGYARIGPLWSSLWSTVGFCGNDLCPQQDWESLLQLAGDTGKHQTLCPCSLDF